MYKFSNVDLIATMKQIVDATVSNYKSDFDYDINALQRLQHIENPTKKDLCYLWITRESGTHLEPEHTLFHTDSYAQLVYLTNEEKGNIFIIDITNPISLSGNITYVVKDRPNEVYGDFLDNDFKLDTYDVVFSSGHKQTYCVNDFSSNKYRLIEKHGAVQQIIGNPSEEAQMILDSHLRILRLQREKAKEMDFEKYIDIVETRNVVRMGDR